MSLDSLDQTGLPCTLPLQRVWETSQLRFGLQVFIKHMISSCLSVPLGIHCRHKWKTIDGVEWFRLLVPCNEPGEQIFRSACSQSGARNAARNPLTRLSQAVWPIHPEVGDGQPEKGPSGGAHILHHEEQQGGHLHRPGASKSFRGVFECNLEAPDPWSPQNASPVQFGNPKGGVRSPSIAESEGHIAGN